jgi:hypothetical protein
MSEKITIAPEEERFAKRTMCLRPRISITAVWDSAGSRGSVRSSKMRLTLRGIMDP